MRRLGRGHGVRVGRDLWRRSGLGEQNLSVAAAASRIRAGRITSEVFYVRVQ